MYIIDITSTDEQIQAVTDKFSGVVTAQGGEVLAAGLWDKRRMAYDIKGKGEGCYLLMYYNGEAAICLELDRVMRISDDVIRHLILNIEPDLVDSSLIRTPGSEAQIEQPVESVAKPEEAEAESAEPAAAPEETEQVQTEEQTQEPAVEQETAQAPEVAEEA